MEAQNETTAEQLADLANLESFAAQGEQIAAQAVQAEQVAAGADSVTEAKAIIGTIAPLAVNFWPWLAPVLTEENKAALATAWAPVMDYYGVTLGGIMSHPLAGALMVTAPMAGQAWQEYRKTQKPAIPAPKPEDSQPSIMLKREDANG